MGGYQPLFIAGNASGLVQNRQNFLLPNDAYPTLINMFLFREQLRRRQGVQFLGRLQLDYTEINYLVFGTAPYSQIFLNVSGYVAGADNSNPGIVTTTYAHGLSTGDGIIFTGIEGAIGYNAIEFFITVLTDTTFNIGVDATAFGSYTTGGTWISNRSLHSQSQNADAQVVPGSFILTSAGVTFTDDGAGNLSSSTPGNTGTINYGTGTFSILTTTVSVGSSAVISYSYYPLLPVMGIRTEEVAAIDDEPTIVFDTQYAYQIVSGVISGLPSVLGVQWTGNNANFFFSTNWWVDSDNNKLFWVTNFSGQGGDPIRYYNTVTWTDFAPVINASNDVLGQCLAMVPFRGRLVVFNTIEGQTLASGVNFYQRIRWSAIGSPLLSNAWRDDIRGQGGFLDIPTSENITAIGFIRDSLVVFCERSTWQLRYTGRSISPFQIEKVNPELGAYSAFSSVQFDTSLVGIGDKGIVECDSYKAVRIDAKIPDLVFRMSNSNSAPQRIQGIRDIQQRLAYWTYVDQDASQTQIADGGDGVYPNRRLVYNYENDSWAIFTDSITSMGTYQPSEGIKWQDATDITWSDANFPWVNRENLFPALLGGNQQGFLFYLGSNLTPQVSNQQTLAITAITPSSTLPVLITAPNHNMVNGQVIQINGIPDSTSFVDLNGVNFGITLVNLDSFYIYTYQSSTGNFDDPMIIESGTYPGAGGNISLRDGIDVISKKFNFLDKGQNIQFGYIDLLMSATDEGAFTMNVYINYNENQPVNQSPQNASQFFGQPDDFYNTTIPTSQISGISGSKYNHRAYCNTRAAFITIEFTLSNAQLNGVEQESDIQIDSQILWLRQAGRLQTT